MAAETATGKLEALPPAMRHKLIALNVLLFGGVFFCFSQNLTGSEYGNSLILLHEIKIHGNTSVAGNEILLMIGIHSGDSVSTSIIEQSIEAIISYYETIGYPFATVSIENISPDDTLPGVDITFNIIEGEYVRIDSIETQGNKTTRSKVIVRESGLTIGEAYNQREVSKIRRRLNRLNIFSKIDDPELFMKDSRGIIRIPVEEGNTNTFDGVIGYVPESGGESGFFTGLINISMWNLFGTARTLGIHWQKDAGSVQEISAQYTEPWLFDLPADVTLKFHQRQQDSTFVQRSYEVKPAVRLFDDFTLGGLLSYEQVIPSNSLSGGALFGTSATIFGIELQYDSRDDPFSPTYGVFFRSDYRTGVKTTEVPAFYHQQISESSSLRKFGVDFGYILPLWNRQVVSLELHGRELSTGYIGIGEMYRLGGGITLRGYKENQFYGSRIAWTNFEYRFLLANRSFVFGFFDTGYYFLPDNSILGISSSQSYKYGYGVGVRVETGIGLVGVSFALGEGDTFTQGKIHFGLIAGF